MSINSVCSHISLQFFIQQQHNIPAEKCRTSALFFFFMILLLTSGIPHGGKATAIHSISPCKQAWISKPNNAWFLEGQEKQSHRNKNYIKQHAGWTAFSFPYTLNQNRKRTSNWWWHFLGQCPRYFWLSNTNFKIKGSNN